MTDADGIDFGLSPDELRDAVRAVLRDVLPAAVLDGARTQSSAAAASPPADEVALRTDADLDAFVRRLAALCADPAQRIAIEEGRHGFRLAAASATSTG